MDVEDIPKLTPADVTRALDLWRKFATQHELNLGDPDRVVYLASRLNETLAKRAAQSST